MFLEPPFRSHTTTGPPTLTRRTVMVRKNTSEDANVTPPSQAVLGRRTSSEGSRVTFSPHGSHTHTKTLKN